MIFIFLIRITFKLWGTQRSKRPTRASCYVSCTYDLRLGKHVEAFILYLTLVCKLDDSKEKSSFNSTCVH
jgi:hypothetical protein